MIRGGRWLKPHNLSANPTCLYRGTRRPCAPLNLPKHIPLLQSSGSNLVSLPYGCRHRSQGLSRDNNLGEVKTERASQAKQAPERDGASAKEKTRKSDAVLVEKINSAQVQRKADWAILKEMSRYLWPKVGK